SARGTKAPSSPNSCSDRRGAPCAESDGRRTERRGVFYHAATLRPVPRRSLAAAILAAALLALTCSTARADGDPASDTLIFQNVFLPYPPPPGAITKPLAAAVRNVYAKGYRVKV